MVKLDKEKCIGCGLCREICGEVFQMDEEGKAEIKEDSKDDNPCIKDAIECCPVNAILK